MEVMRFECSCSMLMQLEVCVFRLCLCSQSYATTFYVNSSKQMYPVYFPLFIGAHLLPGGTLLAIQIASLPARSPPSPSPLSIPIPSALA